MWLSKQNIKYQIWTMIEESENLTVLVETTTEIMASNLSRFLLLFSLYSTHFINNTLAFTN